MPKVTSITCVICNECLDNQTSDEKTAHYDKHCTDEPHALATSPSKPLQRLSSCLLKSKRKLNPSEDLFWYPSQKTLPPPNFTPGLIPILKQALTQSHSRGNTRRAALCYERATHVGKENWDKNWGCGYRNFLMACVVLMDQQVQPMYFPLLDRPLPPSVRNVQQWIETAWEKGSVKGFDAEGAQQLKHSLVDERKWIGTAELYVAFTSRGIPAQLYDFDLNGQPKGVQIVIDWVVQYFNPSPIPSRTPINVNDALRGASPIVVTDRMPLILQHNGHSRLIVGYEIGKTGAVNLITFDPSIKPRDRHRNIALASLSRSGYLPDPGPALSSPSSLPQWRKRKGSTQLSGLSKRPRTNDVDVIVISDSEEPYPSKKGVTGFPPPLEDVNPADLITAFRLDQKRLGRQKQYQILCFPFPLEPPLSEKQMLERRAVFSTRVC